jgi:hypothetical protein
MPPPLRTTVEELHGIQKVLLNNYISEISIEADDLHQINYGCVDE